MTKNRGYLFALEILAAIIFGPVIAHAVMPDNTILAIVSVPVMIIVGGILILAGEALVAIATGKRVNGKADRLQNELDSVNKEYNKEFNPGSNMQPKKKKRKK